MSRPASKPRLRAPGLRRACALPFLLLAVLLQANAVVKSTTMNLLDLSDGRVSQAMAGMDMPGMAMGAAPSHAGKPSNGRAPCSYCAAAAHVPILTAPAPIQPSSAVAFASYRTASLHGPRGPPSVQPRARGPPLTA